MSKRTLAMLLAEMFGTFVLAMVVLSVTRYGLPIFTALAGAAAIGTMATGLVSVSGAHFNPAITLGLFSMRRIGIAKTVAFLAMQAAGAVLAMKLYEWFVDKPLSSASGEFDWRVFTAEMVGAAVFGFVFAHVVTKRADSNLSGATVGWGFFLGATVASLVASAGVINPAVAVSLGFWPDSVGYLAYLLGPVAGAVVGMNLYGMMFESEGRTVTARANASSASVTARKTARKATSRSNTKRRTRR